jgi:hypothetical protein
MKINDWSVVKSPIGVSLRHMEDGRISSNGEVCVSMSKHHITVSIHIDGVDLPITTLTLPVNALKPQ